MAFVPRRRKTTKPPVKKMVSKGKKKSNRLAKGSKSQNSKVDAVLTINCPNSLKIQSGSIAVNYVLGYITALANPPGVGNHATSWWMNPDFLQQQALYDEVCITGYTVYYKPVVTMTGIYDQGSMTLELQRQAEPYIYTWFDRDGSSVTASSTNVPAKLGDYDSFRKHDATKPFKRHIKIRPTWFDCNVIPQSGTNSLLSDQFLTVRGLLGLLGIYGQNLPWQLTTDPETFAMVDVAYHLKFRGKKPVGFTVDRDGVITLTPTKLFSPIQTTMEPLPIGDSGGRLIRDTGTDISGNPLTVLA